MNAPPKLSIVVPVRDEEASLVTLHRELDAAVGATEGGVEMLFVDDGSRDGSLAALREIAAKDRRVRVLVLEAPQGQSGALDAGFRAVRGEWVATLDADLQNDPADLPALLERLAGGPDAAPVDAVCGVRRARRDTWVRRSASRFANAVRNAVTRDEITDVGCSLRVMRSAYLKRVKLYRGLHRFLPTLLRLEGATVVELPVGHRPRRFGRSKYGILDRAWTALVDLIGVRWLMSRQLRARAREDPPAS